MQTNTRSQGAAPTLTQLRMQPLIQGAEAAETNSLTAARPRRACVRLCQDSHIGPPGGAGLHYPLPGRTSPKTPPPVKSAPPRSANLVVEQSGSHRLFQRILLGLSGLWCSRPQRVRQAPLGAMSQNRSGAPMALALALAVPTPRPLLLTRTKPSRRQVVV